MAVIKGNTLRGIFASHKYVYSVFGHGGNRKFGRMSLVEPHSSRQTLQIISLLSIEYWVQINGPNCKSLHWVFVLLVSFHTISIFNVTVCGVVKHNSGYNITWDHNIWYTIPGWKAVEPQNTSKCHLRYNFWWESFNRGYLISTYDMLFGGLYTSFNINHMIIFTCNIEVLL